MCGCEGFYVCPRCTGTPADPLYVDDEPCEPLPAPDETDFAGARMTALTTQW